MNSQLRDRYGRSFPYLRLSLLDACNFKCSYCLPNGWRASKSRPQPLDAGEIRCLLMGFAHMGLQKLRFTGGEPSLRRDLPELISIAAQIPGMRSVALTTNGTQLPRRVEGWRAAGLSHLNVSVDALDRARFATITGHDRLPEVLEGIEQALKLGYHAIKINAVLMRELNDDQLPLWLDYLRDRPVSVRFIELMQTGDNLDFFRRHHVRAEALEQHLQTVGWQLMPRAADAGPAREYGHPDYAGRIGIIAPYSKNFCAGCNRLRVTALGDLRLCLFGNVGIPLRPLLQSDTQLEALVSSLGGQIKLKQLGHRLHEGSSGLVTNLSSIGG